MNKEIKCRFCDAKIEFETCSNWIVFCPYCDKVSEVACEYGYGPVVPCRIYHGSEVVAMVTNDSINQRLYRYDSEKYNVHKILERKYIEALEKASDITAGLLRKKW